MNDTPTHGEILRAIGKLEGTMTTFIATNETRMSTLERNQAIHDVSIANLKVRQAWWAGAAAAVGALSGYLVKLWQGHP